MPRADDDDNGLLRSRAHDPYAFSNSLRDLPPPRLMTKEQAARVREEMAGVQDVVELARKLAEQPRGRFRIAWSKDWRSTSIQQIHDAREVAQLLSYDALLRAHDGDLEGALHSCRAILNVSNAPRDTPSLIAQLIQIALRAIAKGRLERVLAHGEVRADVLAALQRHLEEAAEEPLFLTSLRGERAVMDRFYQAVQAGDVPIGDVGNGLAMHAGLFGQKPDKRLFAEELSLYLPGAVANNRAAYLERMNQLIEVARLAPAEQEERLKEIAAATKGDPILVRLFIPATLRIAEVCRRSQAELRCAAVALAAERYRQKHGRWPKELNNLVPDFLKDVPTDPFDGKPLRYRHDPAGVVIYSIGRDGKDDGGAFDTLNTHRDGTDIGFRLWHVEQRRQPPP